MSQPKDTASNLTFKADCAGPISQADSQLILILDSCYSKQNWLKQEVQWWVHAQPARGTEFDPYHNKRENKQETQE